MKIALVNVEDGIVSIGFRKMAALVKSLHPDAAIRYVAPGRRSLREHLFPSNAGRGERAAEEIAWSLDGADVVGFSSMSIHSGTVQGIIAHLRRVSPRTYVVWGGCHGILDPESAIEHADAVCTGEGEVAFAQLLEALGTGRDPFGTPNFWFRRGGDVVRNGFLPLLTNEELGAYPSPVYGDPGERIFEPGRGFVPMALRHYLKFNGLSYRTVWSIGCPFHCTFCGNTKFIENDPAYQKIRHSPVPALMRELRGVRDRHPHVRSIVFDDDSFMALPLPLIEEFARQYRETVGVPFTVTGVIPSYVRQEKLEVLTAAGLIRIRMGIQSGSERMLRFYERPALPPKVLSSAEVVHRFHRVMIPPAYDIITDNPIETAEDVRATLRLVYDLPRPFTLNVFSLHVMPNTALARQFQELGVEPGEAGRNFKRLAPTLANAVLYLLCLVKPPERFFGWLLSKARPASEAQPLYPNLHRSLRALSLLRRAAAHLRFMDFANLPGPIGYALYRLGALDLWHKHLSPNAGRPRFGNKARLEAS